jgi:hypothetical protein
VVVEEKMMEFVFLVVGLLVGVNLRAEWVHQQHSKTLEQLDQEMREELKFYKNLSESLRQDVLWEKKKRREAEDGKKKEN